ncbi:MAG: hypothetical protein JJ850_16005 [Kordiimonadaceae bacterium]|nr:hypothetical protein [Kordiimonadaceae bacterium]MBO6569592.1 hypothetical protein [Kordiimonadaceae bacterium]MBO6966127.1 hypothetical protein [Kordiimonadaceae bacterium]
MSRVRPDILHEQCNDDYGLLICHNFDWWQEALNLLVPATLWQSMLLSKEEARELDDSNKASVPFTFGGEKFELQAYGLRSKEFVLINDDLRLEIGRTDTAMEWTFGWRATAAGLWEHGVHALRKRVYTMCHQAGLRPRFDGQPWVKLSRADYAFDFWAPGFTPEMEPGIADRFVLPPGVKGHGNFYLKSPKKGQHRAQLETFTIGKKGRLEIQIYDKLTEIREASGKEWMFEVWADYGYQPPGDPSDIWRVEVRMAGDWLKKRTNKDPQQFLELMWELIAEGLQSRRLVVPQETDCNRSRWPLHSLWSLAIDAVGNPAEFVPVGRKITAKRSEVVKQFQTAIAGYMRTAAVVEHGITFSEEELTELANKVVTEALADKDHGRKIARTQGRYEFVDEAR